MLCSPTGRVDVEKVAVATPTVVLRVPAPSVVAPSLKVTTPVGIPAPGPDTATVAVNVTACPKTVEPSDVPTVVDVMSWTTASVSGLD